MENNLDGKPEKCKYFGQKMKNCTKIVKTEKNIVLKLGLKFSKKHVLLPV